MTRLYRGFRGDGRDLQQQARCRGVWCRSGFNVPAGLVSQALLIGCFAWSAQTAAGLTSAAMPTALRQSVQALLSEDVPQGGGAGLSSLLQMPTVQKEASMLPIIVVLSILLAATACFVMMCSKAGRSQERLPYTQEDSKLQGTLVDDPFLLYGKPETTTTLPRDASQSTASSLDAGSSKDLAPSKDVALSKDLPDSAGLTTNGTNGH